MRPILRPLRNQLRLPFNSFRTAAYGCAEGRLLAAFYAALKTTKVPSHYIFVLGHMRSGSSLLVHVLNSNPEIIGLGENLLHYRTLQDLDELLIRLGSFFGRWKMPRECGLDKLEQNPHEAAQTLRNALTVYVMSFFGPWDIPEKYALDKILHNGLEPDESVMERPGVFSLYLLREPRPTMQSLRSLDWHSEESAVRFDTRSEEGCLEYYVSRLESLEKSARRFGDKSRSLFVTYEQLLHQTESTFNALQNWLGLKEPLRQDYDVHRGTGVWGIGDGGENIKGGRIVKERVTSPIGISPKTEVIARESYFRCTQTLRQHCSTIDDFLSADFGSTPRTCESSTSSSFPSPNVALRTSP